MASMLAQKWCQPETDPSETAFAPEAHERATADVSKSGRSYAIIIAFLGAEIRPFNREPLKNPIN